MKKNKTFRSFLALFLTFLFIISSASAIPAVAAEMAKDSTKDDLKWDIDLSKGESIPGTEEYSVSIGKSTMTSIDGTNCLKFSNSDVKIEDTKNQLVTCDTFYVDYKTYFESFPVGTRDGLTSDQYPIAIFTWIVDNNYDRSIRIDSQGNLFYTRYTNTAIGAKLELKKWYNFRFAITPATGAFEIYLDDQLIFSKNYKALTKTGKSTVRFFDTAYEYEAYVKDISIYSNNGYSIVVGVNSEESADYLGYQTTKPVNGKFSVRFLSSLKRIDVFDKIGYNITVTALDENGKITESQNISEDIVVTDSVLADGKTVTAADLETNLLSLFTVKELDADSDGIMLVIRPYVMKDERRIYGKATVLYFNGESENGYPLLSATFSKSAENQNILTCDDTFIQQKYANDPRGTLDYVQLKNNGEGAANTRIAYFKFVIPESAEDKLLNADEIFFRVYLEKTRPATDEEKKNGGVAATVYGTATDWDEKTLTLSNASDGAEILEEVGTLYLSSVGFVSCDVTEYVQNAILEGINEISFRIENVAQDGGNSETVFTSKEGDESKAANLSVTAQTLSFEFGHELNLPKSSNYGYEPWGYAEELVAAWMNGGKDAVYAADNNEVFELSPATITTSNGAHTVLTPGRSTGNPPSGTYKNQYARTLDSLIQNGFKEATTDEASRFDAYGGIINSSIKGDITGFYHVETINGRFYIIDPLGNPFFVVGMNTLNTGSSENQKNATLAKFGTNEAYWESITKSLMEIGVNTATGSFSSFSTTSTPLNGVASVSGIGSYMGSMGLSVSTGGSSAFAYNNTMNVFDPDFVTYVDSVNAANLTKNSTNDKIIGYTSDNELPKDNDMLKRYLTLDPTVHYNAFSYATAWTWLAAKTGKINPTLEDAKNEYFEEFKAFVYSRLFETVSNVIKKYDPNHMYIGTRADAANKTSEGYLRAAGKYCDLLTINMYDGMEPSVKTMATIYRYSGKPFIVTEFYAKAEDAYDMNGQLLANQQNAGWLVKTQQDRANYYENYTLLLLESKYCLGWIWYRFQDNDQSLYTNDGGKTILRVWQKGNGYEIVSYIDQNGNIVKASGTEVQYYAGEVDTSNLGSNKGIVDNKMNFYEPLCKSITRVNANIFKLIQYFDELHK